MYKLIPYYEREMVILRNNQQEATSRHPEIASSFGSTGGLQADPANQRVMQGTALLAAQLSRKLDYFHTRLTNDLLAVLGPYYLNPIPSCAVASFETTEKRVDAPIPRGTEMNASAVPACRFRTVYDVAVPAIAIVAHYTTRVEAPLSLGLPQEAGGAITLTIESKDAKVALAEALSVPVRLCIDTDSATRTVLYDALFACSLCICVEAQQHWHKLEQSPFRTVGFADSEAILPTPQRQDDSLRLLAEYFAFPEKFEFFDIDLKAVFAQCPAGARRVVLHVLLPDMHRTATPHLLRALPATALRLGCTPIVNMFSHLADAIRVKPGCHAYPLRLPASKDASYTIYGVNGMKLLQTGQVGGTAIDMACALGRTSTRDKYCWLFKHADTTAGTEAEVSFVDDRCRPLQLHEGTVKAQLTCTNGELPANLPFGASGGDLVGDRVAAGYRIRLLDAPTKPLELAHQPDSHVDVIGVISANHRGAVQWHLPALLELLRMHARPDCAVTERQIAGIVGVERQEVTESLPNEYGAWLAYGYHIRMTIDEAAFTHRSLYAFAQVMDRVFGYYAPRGNFTRLIVQAADGRELLRCAQRPGGQSPA